jgi:outer membrane protein assembly factor BamE
MTAFSRAALIALLLSGALLGSGGCVYRPNIQQGNLLKTQDVDQVTVGMTRSQVRYLLGTPMLSDSFTPQRWDYIYTFRRGRETRMDRAHFIVHFDGDKVSRIEKPDLPEPPRIDPEQEKAKKKLAEEQAERDARDPPPPPSVSQPQPDAPRPGGGGNNNNN